MTPAQLRIRVFQKLEPLGFEDSIEKAAAHFLGGPPCGETALFELISAVMCLTSGKDAAREPVVDREGREWTQAEILAAIDLMEWAVTR